MRFALSTCAIGLCASVLVPVAVSGKAAAAGPPRGDVSQLFDCPPNLCVAATMREGSADELGAKLGVGKKYASIFAGHSKSGAVYGLRFSAEADRKALLDAYEKLRVAGQADALRVRYFTPIADRKIFTGEIAVGLKPGATVARLVEIGQAAEKWCGKGPALTMLMGWPIYGKVLVMPDNCDRSFVDPRELPPLLARFAAETTFVEANAFQPVSIR